MDAVFIVFVVLVGIGGLVGSILYKQARRKAFAATAAQLGFQYSPHDPFNLLGLPFDLFARGDGRGTENVLWGDHGGHGVRAWEYWYYTRSTDSKGRSSKSYRHFSCAAMELPIVCPETSISRETIFTRLADVVGFRDIEFESEDFNRAMQVKSMDERFATYLIDPAMMHWLMDAGDPWSFHTAGTWLLVVSHRLRPREVPLILDALADFRERMPDVVFETYGGR